MRENWDSFYQHTKDMPPSGDLVKAMAEVAHVGTALDLGCGAGRDTRYLLAQGFHVTAVDKEASSIALLAQLPPERLNFVQSTYEDFAFAQYDLINAHFALPFMQSENFSIVFSRLKTSLNPHGIFVGQFFGVRDEWNVATNHGITFFSRAEALAELHGLDVLIFEEVEIDGKTPEGKAKHWHLYHIIARQLT